jgi:hypothetical protein
MPCIVVILAASILSSRAAHAEQELLAIRRPIRPSVRDIRYRSVQALRCAGTPDTRGHARQMQRRTVSSIKKGTMRLMQIMPKTRTELRSPAVDHYNTGHPHTHILLRGVTEDGKTLNIAGDYIAYGIRERASEIVTRELGRQNELEVTKQLEREVDADRFTGLDRMLIAEQQGREFSDLRPDQDMRDTFRQNRALLIERARKLGRMGLASEIETGKWIVSPKAEPTLRELGERGDIIKTMHRALEREGLAEDRHPARDVLHRENVTERITGRVLDKGLGGDEMGERVHLVIDGVDGRVHHIEMDAARAEEVGRGMIVMAGSAPPGPRAADRNIIDVAGEGGVYRPSQHLERREPLSTVSAATPKPSFAPTFAGWRRCAGPVIRCGSTPITGAFPPIFPHAVKPTIWPGTGRIFE